jgi:hypothetical protein
MFVVALSVVVCCGADNLDSLQFHIIIILCEYKTKKSWRHEMVKSEVLCTQSTNKL